MENSVGDNWLEIVGFPNYQINSNTLEVKNVSKNTILRGSKSKRFSLRNNNTICIVALPRLLFCVMNGISPKEASVNFVIVIDDNKPLVYNKSEYLYKKIKESRKRHTGDIDPLQIYREGRDFFDKIIVSFETRNMDPVFNEIYKYYDDVVGYLLKQRLVYNKDAAREIARCALETTIEHITNGKIVFKPSRYIKNIARYLVLGARSEKKKQREFFDNIAI